MVKKQKWMQSMKRAIVMGGILLNFLFKIFYLKELQRVRERETEIYRERKWDFPFGGLLSEWPQWPGFTHAKTRSQELHPGLLFGPSLLLFPDHQPTLTGSGAAKHWNACIVIQPSTQADVRIGCWGHRQWFSHHAKMLAPKWEFFR